MLPAYDAPSTGQLSAMMLDAFRETGVVILRDFVPKEACAALLQRALELVDEFDASAIRSVFSTMYIFKPPRLGGEVVCHQDSTYLYTEPESCIGFWFALEDATTENGCMYFIPGAHRMPLKQRDYRKPDGKLITETLDDTPWPVEERLAAEATAGTLVIFDGRAPHMSGPNTSGKSRHAYTLHVIDNKCHYPAENGLQRDADLPLRGFDS